MWGSQQNEGSEPEYNVRSRFFAPPPEFDGCFTTFYHLDLTVEDKATISDHLQPEWAGIRFLCGSLPTAQLGNFSVDRPRFVASGPSSLPTHFEIGTTRLWGVGFLPLGWCRFLDVEAASLANTIHDGEAHAAFAKFAPLTEILCDPSIDDQTQFEAISETMRRLMRETRDDDKVIRVHRAMVDENVASVTDFAEAAAVSIRTLERICGRYFGFAPKILLRRQRFMRSLTTFMLHPGGRWTDAMDQHYHDQAQFTREFHTFMGMPPSAYASMEHPILSAFVEARARIWGSPAQTLDKPD